MSGSFSYVSSSGPVTPGGLPSDLPPGYSPTFFATVSFDPIANDGGDGTITAGTDVALSGTVESPIDRTAGTQADPYGQPIYDSGVAATPANGSEVYVYARAVDPMSSAYGTATLLGSATLTDTGTTEQYDYRQSAYETGVVYGGPAEVYAWSLPSSDLSAELPANGIYDLEAFAVGYTYYTDKSGTLIKLSSESDRPAFTYTSIVPSDTNTGSLVFYDDSQFVYQDQSNSFAFNDPLLSTDGRYLVYQFAGQGYERDLQTGAQTSLAPGETPPDGVFGTDQGFAFKDVSQNGANLEYTYDRHFAAGNYTFSAIGEDHPYVGPRSGYINLGNADYELYLNDYYSSALGALYPTVTDNTTGISTLLPQVEGVPVAASSDGNVVLSQSYYFNGFYNQNHASVSYLSAAPTITIDPVDGGKPIDVFPGDQDIIISGTSSAIGSVVEVDFNQAGESVGTATVVDDGKGDGLGTWSLSVDPGTLDASNGSLFVEASVSSAAGTPARTTTTAIINTTPPVATGVSDATSNYSGSLAPGEVLTVWVTTSTPVFVTGSPILTFGNGVGATYASGSGTSDLVFTYSPALGDDIGNLDLTGLDLPNGATVQDAAGTELAYGLPPQFLGVAVDTLPVIEGITPSPDGVETNTLTPEFYGTGTEGDTVTLVNDSGTLGSAVVQYGFWQITTSPLTHQGPDFVDAVETDGAGHAVVSYAYDFAVDSIAPTESLTSLVIGTNDVVSLDDQANQSITIGGTLSSALAAGESVRLYLPGRAGVSFSPSDDPANLAAQGITVSADKLSFTLTVPGSETTGFGVDGTVSAVITDEAGNTGATTAQSFTAAALRPITLITADTANPAASNDSEPALSADGATIAFLSYGSGDGEGSFDGGMDGTVVPGIYVERLATHAVTLEAASGQDPSLSADASVLAFDQYGDDGTQVFVQALGGNAPAVQVSTDDGVPAGTHTDSYAPSLSGDAREVAFTHSVYDPSTGMSDQQIAVATIADGQVASTTMASAPDPAGDNGLARTDEGDGASYDAKLSADGKLVLFTSTSTNLLGQDSGYTANLGGGAQLYVKALADAPDAGLHAGQVELVTGLSDGATVLDGSLGTASLSGDGRYVTFSSSADDLPGSLTGGMTEVYLKDLLTGTVTLVSQTADGIAADAYADAPSISADGRVVVFDSQADNLLPGVSNSQIYAKDLVSGQLTLLSEPGAIPGNSGSYSPSLSADGTEVAFQSYATNLAAIPGNSTYTYGGHDYVTTVPTTPALAITSPDDVANLATTITGTIDALDAGHPITVSGTGAAPAIATVTTTSDPYVDDWAATLTFATRGSHKVSAAATNAAGTATQSLTIDTVPPKRTLATPHPVIVTATVTVSGTIDPDDAADPITIEDDGKVVATTTADPTTGLFSVQAILPVMAADQLTATATGLSGLTGTSNEVDLVSLPFAPAAIPFAQLVATEIDAAPASDTQTLAANTGTLGSQPFVLDDLTQPATVLSGSFPDIIGGSGGLGIDFTGVDAGTQQQKIALTGGINTFVFDHDGYNVAISDGAVPTSKTATDTVFLHGNGTITADDTEIVDLAQGASGVVGGGTDDFYVLESTAESVFADFGTSNVILAGTTAPATVYAGSGDQLFVGGTGSTAIIGPASGTATIVGGATAGATTIFGGAGSLTFFEEGQTSQVTFVGGSGADTIVGGTAGGIEALGTDGSKLTLYSNGLNPNYLLAGAGTEDLIATGSGPATFFGGSASALTAALSDNAHDLFGVGSGSETITAGAGGGDVFVFDKGSAGGNVSIANFTATDKLVFIGYGAGATAAILATGQTTAAGTHYTLPDNTKLTIVGSTSLFDTSQSLTAKAPAHALDGYLFGATVSYADGSGTPTQTGPRGEFLLTDGTGPIVLTGGVDTATGLPFTGTLQAPDGSAIVSPVTTLIEQVAAAAGDDTSPAGLAAAQQSVETALGLSTTQDLTAFDPEGALLDPDATPAEIAAGQQVFLAGAALLDTETTIDAAGGSSAAALTQVAAAIAQGQTVDLTDPATLIDASGLDPAGDAAKAVLDIVRATHADLASQLAAAATPQAAFEAITGSSIALQGDAVTALGTAAQTGTDAAFQQADASYVQALPQTLATDDAQAATNAAAPCFCPGTLILTDAGEVAVERLAVGDRVITADGLAEPIRWIGRRSYAGRFVAGNHLMLPVCIRKDALAKGKPHTDLWVSPGHALFIDGQLVPAWRLINGISVVQAQAVAEVTYIHVELASHDILVANGSPAESFLDDGCRGQFHTASRVDVLCSNASPMAPFAVRLEDGFGLQRAQERIAARAGVFLAPEPAGPLRGFIDVAGPGRVSGWAQDMDNPEEPVALTVLVGYRPVLSLLANRYRADLRQAGLGSGCQAFTVDLPDWLAGNVSVQRATDGASLALTDAAEIQGQCLAA